MYDNKNLDDLVKKAKEGREDAFKLLFKKCQEPPVRDGWHERYFDAHPVYTGGS